MMLFVSTTSADVIVPPGKTSVPVCSLVTNLDKFPDYYLLGVTVGGAGGADVENIKQNTCTYPSYQLATYTNFAVLKKDFPAADFSSIKNTKDTRLIPVNINLPKSYFLLSSPTNIKKIKISYLITSIDSSAVVLRAYQGFSEFDGGGGGKMIEKGKTVQDYFDYLTSNEKTKKKTVAYSNYLFSVEYPVGYTAKEDKWAEQTAFIISNEKGKVIITDAEMGPFSPGTDPITTLSKEINNITSYNESNINLSSLLYYQIGDMETEKTLKAIENSVKFIAFTDVNSLHSNFTAISYLKNKGHVKGYADGTYKPDNAINRVQFLKIVIKALGKYPIVPPRDCFEDTSKSAWYAQYVCYAKEQGIIKGYADGTFRPAKNINFAEAYKMTLTALTANKFDESSGNNWYDTYFDYAYKNNLNLSSKMDPAKMITRGEMAELIFKYLSSTAIH